MGGGNAKTVSHSSHNRVLIYVVGVARGWMAYRLGQRRGEGGQKGQVPGTNNRFTIELGYYAREDA